MLKHLNLKFYNHVNHRSNINCYQCSDYINNQITTHFLYFFLNLAFVECSKLLLVKTTVCDSSNLFKNLSTCSLSISGI